MNQLVAWMVAMFVYIRAGNGVLSLPFMWLCTAKHLVIPLKFQIIPSKRRP